MHEKFKLTTINYDSEIVQFSSEWDELLALSTKPSIYASFDYIFTSLEHADPKAEKVFFIFIRESRNNQLRAIFPMSLWEEKAYRMKTRILKHAITIDNSDVDKPYPIIHKDFEKECWVLFKNYFIKNYTAWDRIVYDEIHNLSQLNHLAKKLFAKPFFWLRSFQGPVSPIVDLSSSWSAFYAKHRNLRRKVRRMQKCLSGGFSYKVYTQQDQMQWCLEQYIRIEMMGWKANKGISSEGDNLLYSELLTKLAKKNQVYFGILFDGENIVAIELSYSYLDKIYFAHGTYNPEYSHLSPGSVSTGKFIEYFHEKNFTHGDFLAGYAHYIDPWAKEVEPSTNMMIIKINFTFFNYCFLKLLGLMRNKIRKLTKRSSKQASKQA